MKNYLSERLCRKGAPAIWIALLSTLCLLTSCKPDLSERDFVLAQKRDSRLIGSWVSVAMHEDPSDNPLIVFEYTREGEVKRYQNGERFFLKYYFYTKGNILYELELGDGFKRSNWTREYEYRFSEDGDTLYIKERGGTMVRQWRRIRDVD